MMNKQGNGNVNTVLFGNIYLGKYQVKSSAENESLQVTLSSCRLCTENNRYTSHLKTDNST